MKVGLGTWKIVEVTGSLIGKSLIGYPTDKKGFGISFDFHSPILCVRKLLIARNTLYPSKALRSLDYLKLSKGTMYKWPNARA